MVKDTRIQALLTEARREQVLDAAAKVFAERGFHKATIKQIAREAEVADGTIYNYFADKTDLLLGLLDRINESGRRGGNLAELGEGNFEVFFTAYLHHRMGVLKDNLELLQAVLPEVMVNEPLRQRYFSIIIAPTYELAEGQFERLQADGVIKPFDIPLLTRVLPATLLGLAVLSILGDEAVYKEWDRLPGIIGELLLNGLVASDREER